MTAATESTPIVRKKATRECFVGVAFRVRLLTAVASFAEGYDMGVTNGVVILMAEDLKLSPGELGLAIGCTMLFMAFAALGAGSLADIWGRKPMIGLSSVLLVFATLIWACATGFWTVIVARALLGTGIGIGISTVTVYMSEVAPANSRGMYASLEDLFLNVGILAGFAANALLVGIENDWRIMVGLGAIPAATVVFALLTPYFPESPRYLQAMGRADEAREVLLELLHGDRVEVDEAVAAWKNPRESGEIAGWAEALRAFTGSHRRAALAGIGCGFMQLLGGIPVFTVYSSFLLTRSAGLSLQESTRITVVLGILKTAVICISSFWLLDQWGRRPLLIISALACSLATGLVGAAHQLEWGATWIVTGIALWAMGFSIGMGPVTFAYIAEVFSNRLRGKGVACALFSSRLLAAAYISSLPLARAEYGLASIFCFLAATNLAVCGYYFCFCPETKGLKLEEIETLFQEDNGEVPNHDGGKAA